MAFVSVKTGLFLVCDTGIYAIIFDDYYVKCTKCLIHETLQISTKSVNFSSDIRFVLLVPFFPQSSLIGRLNKNNSENKDIWYYKQWIPDCSKTSFTLYTHSM